MAGGWRIGEILFWLAFGLFALIALLAMIVAIPEMIFVNRACRPNSPLPYHSADCKDRASSRV